MKTYNIIYVLMALVVVSCSKSDEGSSGGENEKSTDADYALLLSNNNMLTTQLLNANAEVITLNPAQSALPEKEIPEAKWILNSDLLQYHKIDNCNGMLTQHNFTTDIYSETAVFEDLNACDLTVTAVMQTSSYIFVAYVRKEANPDAYFIRIIDSNTSEFTFIDVTLDKKPLDLAVANNRLFVLTIDEQITDENSISVIDLNSNTVIHEMDLGYDAQRIFRNGDDDIVIGYDELHTTLDSSTMAVVYTQYEEGKEPKFANTKSNQFDVSGRLFYPVESGIYSEYSNIPAVHDFSQNLTTLYAFENFLTEEKRTFEFEIEKATVVGYDQENNLILIGYKKTSGPNKGGLLRIKPAPDPEFVDNIDVDGVPYDIAVN